MLLQIILFSLVPSLSIFLGGVAAAFWPPSKKTQSLVQHFAAGVVFAALAGEVLPQLADMHPSLIWLTVGFAIGVFVMLAIRWFVEHQVKTENELASSPSTLLLVVGIDIFIDGLLIGAGLVLENANQIGILLAFALGLEILFLGLATGAEMSEAGSSRSRIIAMVAILAVPPIVGVVTGATLLAGVSITVMVLVLSFAVAALLFLVTEELLVEAHEVPETPIATAAFFVGFLLLFLVEMTL